MQRTLLELVKQSSLDRKQNQYLQSDQQQDSSRNAQTDALTSNRKFPEIIKSEDSDAQMKSKSSDRTFRRMASNEERLNPLRLLVDQRRQSRRSSKVSFAFPWRKTSRHDDDLLTVDDVEVVVDTKMNGLTEVFEMKVKQWIEESAKKAEDAF